MQLHKPLRYIALWLLIFISCYQTAMAFSFFTENSDAQRQQAQQLQIAEQYLNSNKPLQAKQVLNRIDSQTLSSALQNKKRLLDANLSIALGHANQALKILGAISSVDELPTTQKIAYFTLINSAYGELGDFYQSALANMQLTQLTDNKVIQQDYIHQTWEDLQQLTPQELATRAAIAKTNLVKGWINLSILKKRYDKQPAVYREQLSQWEQDYPQHPAKIILSQEGYAGVATTAPVYAATPASSSNVSETLPTSIPTAASSSPLPETSTARQLALLLPLSGPLAESGVAVRNGFMAAYYTAQDEGRRQTVKVYDTYQQSLTSLYQRAANEGASVIVGPLSKDDVSILARANDFSIPTLALNYTPYNSSYLYQFALSPKHEAQLVAQKMIQQGKHQALILSAKDEWATGIVETFKAEFEKEGGTVLSTATYASQGDLTALVKDSLLIPASEARKKSLEQRLQQPLFGEPRRRQDADSVFLVATPMSARSIRPLFKFYYADALPLYSTSMIYSGQEDALRDQDLDGIIFCAMPWDLQQSDVIAQAKQQMQSLQSKPTATSIHLFAFGYDAYQLASVLPALSRNPNHSVSGVTGTIYLSAQQRFYRQLLWAQFQNGLPVQLTS